MNVLLLPNGFRDDDKWEHDLFDDDKPQISSMLLACDLFLFA